MNALESDIKTVVQLLEYQSDIYRSLEVPVTNEVLNKFKITEPDFTVAVRNLVKKEPSVRIIYEHIDGDIPTGPNNEIEFYKILLPKHFNKVIKKYSNAINTKDLSYDPETGIGYFENNKFRFRTNSKLYNVFTELYKKRNRKITQGKILSLIKFYSDKYKRDPDITPESDEISAINKIAVKIRSRVGLTNEQLVMNKGCLILSI